MHPDRITKPNRARLASLFLLPGLCAAAMATPGGRPGATIDGESGGFEL
jgi:hypothetical protein